ncbi:MAG: hypothetical protein WAU91_07445 [Desulfatitalea sp.]
MEPDAAQYDRIARTVFAPVYPLIADHRVDRNLGTETRARFETALARAGIPSFSILHTEEIGLWVVMRK